MCVALKMCGEKVSDNEYTRQTRSMCACCNIELTYNDMNVLFFNFITAIYCDY